MVKKLYKSSVDKKIAGVCGGLGEYFNINSMVIRAIMVILCIAGQYFPVAVAYVVAWIIIPQMPDYIDADYQVKHDINEN